MMFFFSKARTKRSKSFMYRIDGGGREIDWKNFCTIPCSIVRVFIIVSTDTQIYDRSRFERDRETN